MEDAEIIRLYWDRDPDAIPATEKAYGGYCAVIAQNILGSPEDAEECVNDGWLRAWNTIPPHRPEKLAPFLGKIVRNLALNRYRRNTAAKRGGGQAPAVLEELAEVVSGAGGTEEELDRRELLRAIDSFLDSLPPRKRDLFVRRYWYFDGVSQLAGRFGITETNAAVTLSRLRRKLRDYLLERGFAL